MSLWRLCPRIAELPIEEREYAKSETVRFDEPFVTLDTQPAVEELLLMEGTVEGGDSGVGKRLETINNNPLATTGNHRR